MCVEVQMCVLLLSGNLSAYTQNPCYFTRDHSVAVLMHCNASQCSRYSSIYVLADWVLQEPQAQKPDDSFSKMLLHLNYGLIRDVCATTDKGIFIASAKY
jgi:hypothetical protein